MLRWKELQLLSWVLLAHAKKLRRKAVITGGWLLFFWYSLLLVGIRSLDATPDAYSLIWDMSLAVFCELVLSALMISVQLLLFYRRSVLIWMQHQYYGRWSWLWLMPRHLHGYHFFLVRMRFRRWIPAVLCLLLYVFCRQRLLLI